MKLSLLNKGTESVLVVDSDGNIVDALEPQLPYEIDDPATVLVIGDKPDLREQLAQAKDVLSKVAQKIIAAISGRVSPSLQGSVSETITVSVRNSGGETVRAIRGDGKTDMTIAPGSTQDVMSMGYIELRELGHVNPNIEKQPSEAA